MKKAALALVALLSVAAVLGFLVSHPFGTAADDSGSAPARGPSAGGAGEGWRWPPATPSWRRLSKRRAPR